ncbi:predicted protein [Uncinocarpus reesii 1704]|uniref:SET domain-containing protein n=1 Tax=Uncinocarpus reesii (strain UAMH 1704) TaxID=336963 RepID=C4JJQ5_UNCRE|nr:uncharacterized protein UREG_01862 [Uncinocarpus reesii 1704]EEP77013.1 predicted protein [Uncinocarpus reesii 1704]
MAASPKPKPMDTIEVPLNEFCVIKPTPAKGYGVFATRNIPQGTRVLSESRILNFPGTAMEPWGLTKDARDALVKSIGHQLSSLAKEQQREFFALANAHKEKLGAFLGIAVTNAIIMDYETKEHGVFLQAARFNHACRPNAMRTFHPILDQVVIHVAKDVSEGEEITVSYIEPAHVFSLRVQLLKAKFGFTCVCELCVLPVREREISDLRISTIILLFNSIRNETVIMNEPLASLHNTHTAMLLQKEEGILEILASTFYYDAATILSQWERKRW